jgi:hypothetical protein
LQRMARRNGAACAALSGFGMPMSACANVHKNLGGHLHLVKQKLMNAD